ncbi:hypothetical protein [Flavobacterium silvaticum]|uniref:Uncharacterized protein n=1 Tax=Flavobacterium silvaticum TaxID=1852020 RepID=A0A972G1T7_9FLAO|nr:hypothetical protein [Flavobacterium silvaticum]NMH28896.1 hypothetical protein [Flavobacterium silvaticum]
MKWIYSLLIFAFCLSGVQAQKAASAKKTSQKTGQEKLVKPEKSKTEVDTAGTNENVQGSGMTTAKDIPADKLDRNQSLKDNPDNRTEPVAPAQN